MSRLAIPQISKGFFATVIPFRTDAGKARYDAATLRSTMQEVFAAQEAAAGSRRVDYEIYDHAKYAMVALVDELAIVSEWAPRNDWAQEPLELAVFNTNVAGEEFFDRLEKLKKRFAQNRDEEERETLLGAIEVFFTCLECGFKGRFRGGGEGELKAVHSGLLAMLWPPAEAQSGRPLFPEAYGEADQVDKKKMAANFWPLIAILALLLLFGAYVLGNYTLSGTARNIESSVEKHAEDALESTEGGD
jgi:type VI secretion system protein ImpK